MINTLFTTDEIREKYDEMAAEYQREEWFGETVLRGRRLRRRLFSRARGRVLDVACGTGVNFPHFDRAASITGVELSPAMLALARQRADALGRDVSLQEMDAARLAFPDASFDTVTSALSTCTFPDPGAALREMARVCKPDGRILLFEHGRSSWPPFAWLQDRTAQRHYHMAGCRWNQEPVDLVQYAGLSILTAERHLAGVFHTLVAAPATA